MPVICATSPGTDKSYWLSLFPGDFRLTPFSSALLLATLSLPAFGNLWDNCRGFLAALREANATYRRVSETEASLRSAQREQEDGQAPRVRTNPFTTVLEQLDLNRQAFARLDAELGLPRGRELLRQIGQKLITPESLGPVEYDLALHTYLRDILEHRHFFLNEQTSRRKLENVLHKLTIAQREIDYYSALAEFNQAHPQRQSHFIKLVLQSETRLRKFMIERDQLLIEVETLEFANLEEESRLAALALTWPEAAKARLYYTHQFLPYQLVEGRPELSHRENPPPTPP